jgi:hypothetical protein
MVIEQALTRDLLRFDDLDIGNPATGNPDGRKPPTRVLILAPGIAAVGAEEEYLARGAGGKRFDVRYCLTAQVKLSLVQNLQVSLPTHRKHEELVLLLVIPYQQTRSITPRTAHLERGGALTKRVVTQLLMGQSDAARQEE